MKKLTHAATSLLSGVSFPPSLSLSLSLSLSQRKGVKAKIGRKMKKRIHSAASLLSGVSFPTNFCQEGEDGTRLSQQKRTVGNL